MTDEPKAGADPANINNKGNGDGADPIKPDNAAKPDAVDPKDGEKPFDEKVFDDPRLWTHPRFKSLNDRAKKATELEKAQSVAEEKALAENKKFEELATKREAERDTAQSKLTQSLQDNRIITEATKIGVVDIEAVLKLVDRSSIAIDDNGVVTGAIEAVTALVADKPYLKGKANVTIGSPTNPGADSDNAPKTFKLSQLQDPAFFKEHEADIAKAYAAGKIEDDMTP